MWYTHVKNRLRHILSFTPLKKYSLTGRTWCKEHHSCPPSPKAMEDPSKLYAKADNIEITAHGMPPEDEAKNSDSLNAEDRKFLTKLLYGLIGIVSSLAFFLVLYWVLRLDSAITNVITNTYDTPLYFWPYVILTLGAIVLFGVNVSLLVYRWRKFGPPKLKTEGGTGLGSLFGIAASACPVCGSTLLSAIGIAGGLAAFPLGGLELKALSFGFLALPLWLIRKDLKKLDPVRSKTPEASADVHPVRDAISNGARADRTSNGVEADCLPAEALASSKPSAKHGSAQAGESGVCPLPKDHSFKESDRPWLFVLLALVVVLSLISWNWLKTEPIIARAFADNSIINPNDNQLNSADVSSSGNPLFDEVTAKVLPEKGYASKIALGNSIVGLVENGVIDREKFLAIYQDRGDLPPELKDVLDKPLTKPILLTRKNANYYVNLLWPLGLANYMESNKKSPVNGKSLFNFASTGGWNLGKEENGGAYFNKFNIMELTPVEEALVTKIAENTYRPCCNNSTFFQDCNHGSALLGLLELGAAQGLTEDELYREALAFNSFWFPHNYIQNALYFKAVKGIDWEKVDPKEIMGFDYSAIGPWSKNIQAELAKIPNLLPQNKGGASCGT